MTQSFQYERIDGNTGGIPAGTKPKVTENIDGTLTQHVITDSSTDAPTYITPVGDGYISTGNTTEVNLAAGATFEGTFDNCIEYGGIRVALYSSHASATRGLEFWCSKDGANGFVDDSYTVPAATAKTYAVPVSAPYFKLRYTNGGTQTTTLKICTIFQRNVSVVSSHRLGDNVIDDDDAQLTTTVLKAKLPSGAYSNIDATAGGNLKVSLEEIETGVTIPTTRADDGYNDAFQRLRVSNTDQRFDAEFLYSKQPLLFDEIAAGAGVATHNAQSRDVTLATNGTALADGVGLFQHWYNPYTAGNSQEVIITGTLNEANLSSGTVQAFLRSSVTTDTTVETVDITSAADWRYSQIFVIDFQSLKVGRIRFALDQSGLAVPVASIENDNERVGGYWQMANAPVYWKVYNTDSDSVTEFGYGDSSNAVGFIFRAPISAAHKARAICTTVKSEGGGDLLDIAGFPFSAGNGVTSRAVSTTLLPLVSIQLKTTFGAGTNRGIVIPTGFSIANDNPVFYQLIVNGTLTGASFASVDANSLCNVDVSASAITGGRVISSGYAGVGGTRSGASEKGITNKTPLSVNYVGTTGDILTLAAVRFGNTNAATGAALEWREVR
jgi:hypothetical protein